MAQTFPGRGGWAQGGGGGRSGAELLKGALGVSPRVPAQEVYTRVTQLVYTILRLAGGAGASKGQVWTRH